MKIKRPHGYLTQPPGSPANSFTVHVLVPLDKQYEAVTLTILPTNNTATREAELKLLNPGTSQPTAVEAKNAVFNQATGEQRLYIKLLETINGTTTEVGNCTLFFDEADDRSIGNLDACIHLQKVGNRYEVATIIPVNNQEKIQRVRYVGTVNQIKEYEITLALSGGNKPYLDDLQRNISLAAGEGIKMTVIEGPSGPKRGEATSKGTYADDKDFDAPN